MHAQKREFNRSVNAPALGAAAFGYLAHVFAPEAGDYAFGDWVLAGFAGIASATCAMQAISGARNDFQFRRAVNAARVPSGVHGQARFATWTEREAAKLHDPSGLMMLGLADGVPVFSPKQSHVAIQAMTGAGKTTALIAGAAFHALHTGRSVVISDPKPEVVFLHARTFQARGFRVVINNPAGLDLSDLQDTNSNPFHGLIEAVHIAKLNRDAFPLAESFARALIPESKNDKNRFFTELDRAILIAVLITLAVFEPENCYPSQAWRSLTDPRRFKELLHLAMASEVLDGDLAAIASGLHAKSKDNPEHLESGRTGAANALSVFKTSSSLGQVGISHDFDPKDFRDPDKPPVALFDVIPADRIDVFAKANELNQIARLGALKRHCEGREVVFLMDEASVLKVPQVVSDIEILRSFGVRLVLAFQSWSGLKAAYGEDNANRLRSNCTEVFFSVSDLATAEDISKRVGDTTVKTSGHTFGEGKPSTNIGETGRKLLPPEEILSLPKNTALALIPGLRPVLFEKLPWYEVEPFKSLAGENPHERHPVSKVTRLRLDYGRGADDIRPPRITSQKNHASRSNARVGQSHQTTRVPLITAKKLRWVPVIAACAFLVTAFGTPHIIFPVNLGADARGLKRCAYVGLEGFKNVAREDCPVLVLLHADEGRSS